MINLLKITPNYQLSEQVYNNESINSYSNPAQELIDYCDIDSSLRSLSRFNYCRSLRTRSVKFSILQLKNHDIQDHNHVAQMLFKNNYYEKETENG